MPDSRFFTPAGPFTLAELAAAAAASIAPGGDAGRRFFSIAALEEAGPGDVSFLENRRYIDAFARTRAGCCVVDPRFAERAPAGLALLLTDKPYKGFALIAQAFYPDKAPAPGRHASAIVDPTAKIDTSAGVAAGAVIGARAEIGARVSIGANAVIGDGVIVGADTAIGACAVLNYCLVGARVLIHPGVCIGNRGFGFAMDPAGHVRIPQVGRVVIEDDVEIGANSTVDRGAGGDTVIGRGTMIDNLVMIAHNVRIGRGCVVIAQVGISGSTKLGNHVVIAGQGGLSGHLTIGDGARIAAKAGVFQDVEPGGAVGGVPAVPIIQWHRQTAILGRLAKGKAVKAK
ncbi:MAG: UDP-3-O-(3-hydroxymyristoyl)glucosamine N-acyltransferase [Rhodospirillales bacterium]